MFSYQGAAWKCAGCGCLLARNYGDDILCFTEIYSVTQANPYLTYPYLRGAPDSMDCTFLLPFSLFPHIISMNVLNYQ